MNSARAQITLLIILVLSVVFICAAQADLQFQWEYFFDNTVTADSFYNLGFASDGFAIAMGQVDATSTNSMDIILASIEPNGAEQWATQWTPNPGKEENGYSLAIDNSDDILVAGRGDISGTSKAIVVKFDRQGTFLWHSIYQDSSPEMAYFEDMVLDDAGNAYVTGAVKYPAASDFDILVCKIDPAGNILWADEVNGSHNNIDMGEFIRLDDMGNVYVLAHTVTALGDRPVVLKWDNNGVYQWSRVIPGIDTFSDDGQGMEIWNNTPYVATASYDQTNAYHVIKIHKMNTDGSGETSVAYDLGAHANLESSYGHSNESGFRFSNVGHIYLAGFIMDNYDFDMFVAKFDNDMSLLWEDEFDIPNEHQWPTAMDVADNGDFYVSGITADAGVTYTQAFVVGYDGSGNTLGSFVYKDSTNEVSVANDITLDDRGNPYVAMETGNISAFRLAGVFKLCIGCLIGNDCIADGELNPSDTCQVCRPGDDNAGWTINEGAPCEDGVFCNGGDTCNAQGLCEEHLGDPCDPGFVCNEDTDTCDPEGDDDDNPPVDDDDDDDNNPSSDDDDDDDDCGCCG